MLPVLGDVQTGNLGAVIDAQAHNDLGDPQQNRTHDPAVYNYGNHTQ